MKTLATSLLIASVAIGSLSLASCGKKTDISDAKAKDSAETFTVKTDVVAMAPMASSIKVTGSLEGIREAIVSSETQGRVLTIAHTTGDRVAQGTAIVKVDDELKIIGVHQSEAAALAAEASLEKAKIDLGRAQQLLGSNASTKSQVEMADLQVKSAEAQLKAAQAQESMMKRQVADANVKAPFAGVITMRYVNQGEMLAPGQKVISLVDDSRMKLKMSIGEMDLTGLKVRDKVAINVDALPGQTFDGTIASISDKADAARTFAIEVEIPNSGHNMKSGMFARGTITRGEVHDVMTVPNTAIIASGSKAQIYVVKNGVVNLRAVKLGSSDNERVEVVEGIQAGDEVVVFGQSQLHDGVKVRK